MMDKYVEKKHARFIEAVRVRVQKKCKDRHKKKTPLKKEVFLPEKRLELANNRKNVKK